MKTLVLDVTFCPINIWSWQKAMTKKFKDENRHIDSRKLNIVKVYEDRIRDGSGNLYYVPCVISIMRHINPINRPATYGKNNIYARDLNKCMYCGRIVSGADRTIDHVMPRSKGGKSVFENVVTSCIKCNRKKGNMTLGQVGMRLMNKPKRITMAQAYKNKLILGSIPPEWWEYI